ncbi:hypothetical protein [Halorussus lipolyticus]|uniref:hypothetical protein n=1 Tax=Halorussus lipolyticus TaxID=3034024 RepID=UPI0023E81E12|nr:hypothetical protein [Halorussus sp. DT80]
MAKLGGYVDANDPLIENAYGDSVKSKYLLKRKPGFIAENLYKKAPADYLEESEQPHYLLKSENSGLKVFTAIKGLLTKNTLPVDTNRFVLSPMNRSTF